MKRRYGQHYLNDEGVVKRIVDAAGAGATDAVLEIGPGKGALTRALAARARAVMAVEIDRHLFSELQTAGLPGNVTLRLGDALEIPFNEVVSSFGHDYHVVANLPYEITSAFLRRYLSDPLGPRTMTVMIQKEVGERIVSAPGDANRLGLFCGYYAVAEKLFDVPPGAFTPPPKVTSCVIRLVRRPKPLLPPAAEACFFRLTEAAFAEKRRNLRNSLRKILGPDIDRRLEESGLNSSARPEEISLSQWVSLALKVC